MISESSSVDHRVVLFFLYFFLSSIMADNASAPSTTSDAPVANTGMCAGTRPHRHYQPFKGQNLQLWNLKVTTDNLKHTYYNKIKQQTLAVASPLCNGNITHVLQAIETGKDTVFIKPILTSVTPTKGEKMEFKIDCVEYSEDKHTYENNKTKLAQSLIGQCALPVVDQLRDMKDHK